MCGIAGFIGQGNEAVGKRMIESLRHRGPDDQGIFFDKGICLAHRRLSVIDLSAAGHQPMWSNDGKVAIVFNGEIYNFQEIRQSLVGEGYKFRSASDTEVIVALYRTRGEKCFSMLDGMFSIALWDNDLKKLFLARDRMGKKPLYWGIFSGTFIFGSELKAVLAHPDVSKKLSPEALQLYLTHKYIPTPWTPFEAIFKAKPGVCLIYSEGKIEEKEFWNTDFLRKPVKSSPFSDDMSRLDGLLEQAVKERLVADVPLGVFLSGGLDSSVVAYYASCLLKKRGDGPLHTFSIGFTEKSFDESFFAKQVADHIGSNHHVRIFTSADALTILPDLVKQMDEPFADASLLPTSLLSRFAREQVTVALGGDGGDEMFLGYDTFFAHKLAERYRRIPKAFRRLIEVSVKALPTSHTYMSFDFKAKRFIRGAELQGAERHLSWIGAFTQQEVQQVLSAEMREKTSQFNSLLVDRKYWSEAEGDDLRHASWLYARTYMMDGVMVKADRASMLASLEVRSPLLATALVEFAYGLPSSAKLQGRTGKFILKKVMEGKLPDNIIYRKKKGFAAPIGEWLRGPLLPLLKEKLAKEYIEKQGLFDADYVNRLVADHESGRKDNRDELWTLLMFQLWYHDWCER